MSLHGLDTPPSTQGGRPLRAGSLSQAISRDLARNNAPPTQNPTRIENGGAARPPDAQIQKEIDALRAQLAQAESERQKLRASLEESKETNFAKAGEAENLRRTMRKQTEQHAEEVTRLRQEMAEAENAKLDTERRMKLEMDQLRTAMTFKQYERETSRKGFPNVNASLRKRQAPGSTQTQNSTPTVSRIMEDIQHSPLSPKKKVSKGLMPPPPLPEKSFSNLTNSFAPSTSPVKQPRNGPKKPNETTLDYKDPFAPVQTSTQHPPNNKGKGKAKLEDNWLDENTTVPAISGYLLKAGTREGDSLLASTICSVILKCTKDKLDQSVLWHLGESTLTLLSALARTAGVLPVMLDSSYPPPWTVRVTRALGILASRPALVRGLLTFPEIDPATAHDLAKIPLVELLCRHLSVYRKNDTKEHHQELYDNVLIALSQLAIADTQSLTTLVDSLTLIPSLVSFIYHVTSAIWSELELSENSAQSDDS
ncbi:hypothetical protein FRC07_007469 [Ceratobasidium sp. 392]|nr:hypothetical protein FRC07_007469 [Ceratobasidium sp. 392]